MCDEQIRVIVVVIKYDLLVLVEVTVQVAVGGAVCRTAQPHDPALHAARFMLAGNSRGPEPGSLAEVKSSRPTAPHIWFWQFHRHWLRGGVLRVDQPRKQYITGELHR